MQSALSVRNIHKSYGATRALAGLDLEVRRGEVFALLGTNGAGKTTFFRILMGIHLPDQGEMQWDLPGSGSRPGYLPEERGLQQDVPIERTLIFLGRLRGMTARSAKQAAAQWLERMGLSERAGEKLDALSKGNQQKVQIAAALLHQPSFALLDEPFSGFDPVNQELLLELIAELRNAGTTVLFSAHQLELVERACDRVGLLHGGKLEAQGTLAELRARAAQSQGGHTRLVIQLDGEGDETHLDEVAGIDTWEPMDDAAGSLRLNLAADTETSVVLAELATTLPLRAARVEEPSLHDLYLGTVRSSEDSHA